MGEEEDDEEEEEEEEEEEVEEEEEEGKCSKSYCCTEKPKSPEKPPAHLDASEATKALDGKVDGKGNAVQLCKDWQAWVAFLKEKKLQNDLPGAEGINCTGNTWTALKASPEFAEVLQYLGDRSSLKKKVDKALTLESAKELFQEYKKGYIQQAIFNDVAADPTFVPEAPKKSKAKKGAKPKAK